MIAFMVRSESKHRISGSSVDGCWWFLLALIRGGPSVVVEAPVAACVPRIGSINRDSARGNTVDTTSSFK